MAGTILKYGMYGLPHNKDKTTTSHDNTVSTRADQSRASAVDTHIQRIKIW